MWNLLLETPSSDSSGFSGEYLQMSCEQASPGFGQIPGAGARTGNGLFGGQGCFTTQFFDGVNHHVQIDGSGNRAFIRFYKIKSESFIH